MLSLIERSDIPEEDKKALVGFSEVLRAQGLTLGRVMKYLYHLRVCAVSVGGLSGAPSLVGADANAVTSPPLGSTPLRGSSRRRGRTSASS